MKIADYARAHGLTATQARNVLTNHGYVRSPLKRPCVLCGQVTATNGGPSVYCAPCKDQRRRERSVAALAVRKAVASGDIPAAYCLPCVDCGKPASEYDHRDYSKPLDVVPVCRGCNIRRGPAKKAA